MILLLLLFLFKIFPFILNCLIIKLVIYFWWGYSDIMITSQIYHTNSNGYKLFFFLLFFLYLHYQNYTCLLNRVKSITWISCFFILFWSADFVFIFFFMMKKKRISSRHTARDNHVVYIKEDVYSFLFVIEWKNVWWRELKKG